MPHVSIPRVSLIVLAYNQQEYIEAATAGALAQDYPNLEIIVSDDCSPDATFEIIQRLQRDYTGPHRFIANRTPENSGVLGHFYQVVAKSTGRLIVAAGGDDISLPERVSTLAHKWQETGAAALSSDWYSMDESGTVGAVGSQAAHSKVEARWFADGNFTPIAGAMAAYDRSVFESIALPDIRIMAEDYFFALALHLRSKKVVHVAAPLVQYRAHSQSIVNRAPKLGDELASERSLEAYSAKIGMMYAYLVKLARTGAGVDPGFGEPAKVHWPEIRAQIADEAFRSRWIDASIGQRLSALARPPYNLAKLRWYLPRLGGIASLRATRRLAALVRRFR